MPHGQLPDVRLDAAPPSIRFSPWYGYAPLGPAVLATADGVVFVKDVLQP